MTATTPAPAAHLHVATLAVVQHALDHQLPAPWAIRPNQSAISVDLPMHAYTAWAGTLTLTRETSEPASPSTTLLYGPGIRYEAEGTLPGTGVRVMVSGVMLSGLRAVNAS